MEKQTFEVAIDAPREKVWNILWDNATYPLWTASFSEGSHAETDWKKGSKVLFVDDKNQGMVSTVVENIPYEFMSFKHLGEVKDGVETYFPTGVNGFGESLENYTLKTVNGKTSLVIEMDVPDEYKDYFQNTWPKALDAVKTLSEKK